MYLTHRDFIHRAIKKAEVLTSALVVGDEAFKEHQYLLFSRVNYHLS